MSEQPRLLLPASLPSEAALLADLAATFPGLDARSLRTWCDGRHGTYGAVFSNCIRLPDGEPIYLIPSEVEREPDTHPGYIHGAFDEWLGQRGWYVECYDYGTYLIVPVEAALSLDSEETMGAYRAAVAAAIAADEKARAR